jgi:hypothetical protein
MIKSWREAKRSPYFFLRVQAAKRMQTYLFVSLALIVVTFLTTAYAWNSPEDTTARVALLTRAKPVSQLNQLRPAADGPTLITDVTDVPTALEISMAPGVNRVSSASNLTDPLLQPQTLPAEFDQFEPTAELTDATKLGEIAFSTDITSDYQPINSTRRFVSGYFTIYATFSYDGMANGMVWSWIWRWNGEIVDGGNQIWNYGPDGPGYVYFAPEEGFRLGEYTLDIWLNGKLFNQANLMIVEGATAGN